MLELKIQQVLISNAMFFTAFQLFTENEYNNVFPLEI